MVGKAEKSPHTYEWTKIFQLHKFLTLSKSQMPEVGVEKTLLAKPRRVHTHTNGRAFQRKTKKTQENQAKPRRMRMD